MASLDMHTLELLIGQILVFQNNNNNNYKKFYIFIVFITPLQIDIEVSDFSCRKGQIEQSRELEH